MSIKSILATFLLAAVVSVTSGCGSSDELSVVQPDEAHMQQLQADEDLEKSGAMTVRQ